MKRLISVAMIALAIIFPSVAIEVAGAQEQPPVLVTIEEHTRHVAPQGTLDFSLLLTGSRPDGAELFVEVFPQIEGGREAFDRAASGQFDTSTVGPGPVIYPLDTDDYEPDEAGKLAISVPTFVARSDQRIGTVRLAVAGVYPVRISVRDGDTNDTLGQALTFITRLPDGPVEGELATALVLPLDAAPSTPADPSSPVTVDAAAIGRWQAILEAALAHPDVALTLVPRPETVAALSEDPADAEQALREGLGELSGQQQVLAPPYVAVDAAALVANGLTGELTDQLERGTSALDRELALRPDRRTWLADADLDADTARQLEVLAVDQWLLSPDAVEPVDPVAVAPTGETDASVTHASSARVGDHTLDDVAVPHVDLSGAFAQGGGRAAANLFLAELTAIWFDAPEGARSDRGVVIVTPPDWTPDAEFVAAVLDGLADDPLLRPVTIDQWFASVDHLPGTDGRPLARTVSPQPPADLGTLPDLIEAGQRELGTLTSQLPDGARAPEVQRLRQGLAVMASRALDPGARIGYVAQITGRNDELKTAVGALAPETITLTSRRATLTVTLENELAEPVRTRLQLSSSKLAIAEPDRTVVLQPGQTLPLSFDVQARSTGSFGLDIAVRSPDGAILMRRARWTIRSTAVTGMGWMLSIGGLVFLAGWWGLHVRRDRRLRTAEILASRDRHPSGP